MNSGIIYIVGTPIGNLEDMTFRAVRILQTVNLIAAEDTRHTGKLLHHFQITTPQISYHDHNRHSRQEELLNRLKQGENIALVSDAGMPGISDPGYELIKACLDSDISVVPIPGATAAITALSCSGLPTEKFVFEGFLPTKKQERSDRLNHLKTEIRTIILYEAPHRLLTTLVDLADVFGKDRPIVLAREITKLYEEFWRGTMAEAVSLYQTNNPKGEYTLVIAGDTISTEPKLSEEELIIELQKLASLGISKSQASRQLAQITKIPRRQIYEIALKM